MKRNAYTARGLYANRLCRQQDASSRRAAKLCQSVEIRATRTSVEPLTLDEPSARFRIINYLILIIRLQGNLSSVTVLVKRCVSRAFFLEGGQG